MPYGGLVRAMRCNQGDGLKIHLKLSDVFGSPVYKVRCLENLNKINKLNEFCYKPPARTGRLPMIWTFGDYYIIRLLRYNIL